MEMPHSYPRPPARKWWILNMHLSGLRAQVLSFRVAVVFVLVSKLSSHKTSFIFF